MKSENLKYSTENKLQNIQLIFYVLKYSGVTIEKYENSFQKYIQRGPQPTYKYFHKKEPYKPWVLISVSSKSVEK